MNVICERASLRNEADVEQVFVRRLLERLGYSDAEIVPKASLDALGVKGVRGIRQAKYKPDFALKPQGRLRFLIEAKAPNEPLEDHEWQPRGYAILLNGTDGANHIERYMLTNGVETRVYDPQRNASLYTVRLEELNESREALDKLSALIGPLSGQAASTQAIPTITLRKLTIGQVNQVFGWCHQHIYRKDHISQSDAFTEFVKLISLKLMSDRDIKARFPQIISQDSIAVPSHEVRFSLDWLARHRESSANPFSDIQFRSFMRDRENEIATGIRKRMFDEGEGIALNPETIEGVVRKLESVFLFGIDADLNGRLFETFLNATMRGKDLGQFFTPRSLVKLGVGLAQLKVGVRQANGEIHTDMVIDACCGSGGFLIDALADMWERADRMPLSREEVSALKREIANTRIVGVDVANAPKLARIARLNMYLHGDGGAKIFHANALDKRLLDRPTDPPEMLREKSELRQLLGSSSFDVALTNPPFAKALDRSTEEEAAILASYEIARAKELRGNSVRSNLLFIERYRDVLKPGGRLVTVLDDGVLSGDDHAWFRARLRAWFSIKAIVSLPGDAFQRSNARVKTSYVVAERRSSPPTADEWMFMYPCTTIGLDDPKRQRARASDTAIRTRAKEEVTEVIRQYELFQSGASSEYRFPAGVGDERMDVKFRMFRPNRLVEDWHARGFNVFPLSHYLAPRHYLDDDVVQGDSEEPVRVIVVRYTGTTDEAEEVIPKESSYGKLFPVRTGDIVVSNIAASYGSIAVVPEELDGAVVSSEYTVLTPNPPYNAEVLKRILRSPEVRADILLSSSGANRTRTRWSLMKAIEIHYPVANVEERITSKVADARRALREAQLALKQAQEIAEQELGLRSVVADTILEAFRPPK